MKKSTFYILIFLETLGVVNSVYLTYEHYAHIIPPCSTHFSFINCGKVLQSVYSTVLGIPIALFGVVFFSSLLLVTFIAFIKKKKIWRITLIVMDTSGALTSSYLMYLQIFVIKSICIYCTLSALICFILFGLTIWKFKKEWKEIYSYIRRTPSRIIKLH